MATQPGCGQHYDVNPDGTLATWNLGFGQHRRRQIGFGTGDANFVREFVWRRPAGMGKYRWATGSGNVGWANMGLATSVGKYRHQQPGSGSPATTIRHAA